MSATGKLLVLGAILFRMCDCFAYKFKVACFIKEDSGGRSVLVGAANLFNVRQLFSVSSTYSGRCLMRIGALLLVSCFLLVGCGSEPLRSWPELKGRVLDAETEEPIPGVHVIVVTQGHISVFVDTQSVCYHIDAAVTDSDGQFEIPAWNEGLAYSSANGKHRSFSFFKAGYARSKRTNREMSYRKNIWYQQKFRGTRAEWLERLDSALSSAACGGAGKTQLRVFPMLEALLSETQRWAEEDEEKKFRDWLIIRMNQIRKDAGK